MKNRIEIFCIVLITAVAVSVFSHYPIVANITSNAGLYTPPTTNNADNFYISDVIGQKGDDHNGETLFGLLSEIEDHIHNAAFVYPSLNAAVTITGGAGAWQLGNYAEVIPANTINQNFDIHYINIKTAPTNDSYQLELYSETEVIAQIHFEKSATSSPVLAHPILTPMLDPNEQIRARVATAGGGGDAPTISVTYHKY
jgi:hypothetical protein